MILHTGSRISQTAWPRQDFVRLLNAACRVPGINSAYRALTSTGSLDNIRPKYNATVVALYATLSRSHPKSRWCRMFFGKRSESVSEKMSVGMGNANGGSDDTYGPRVQRTRPDGDQRACGHGAGQFQLRRGGSDYNFDPDSRRDCPDHEIEFLGPVPVFRSASRRVFGSGDDAGFPP